MEGNDVKKAPLEVERRWSFQVGKATRRLLDYAEAQK
jgi:hypothetical protein